MLSEPSTKIDPDGTGPSLSYPTGIDRDSYMPSVPNGFWSILIRQTRSSGMQLEVTERSCSNPNKVMHFKHSCIMFSSVSAMS